MGLRFGLRRLVQNLSNPRARSSSQLTDAPAGSRAVDVARLDGTCRGIRGSSFLNSRRCGCMLTNWTIASNTRTKGLQSCSSMMAVHLDPLKEVRRLLTVCEVVADEHNSSCSVLHEQTADFFNPQPMQRMPCPEPEEIWVRKVRLPGHN